MNSQYRKRRRASQKTDVKKVGRTEDQDEEDQRKTSKLIAYLGTKSENCIIVQEKMQCFVKWSNRCIQNLNHLYPSHYQNSCKMYV